MHQYALPCLLGGVANILRLAAVHHLKDASVNDISVAVETVLTVHSVRVYLRGQ
jgi:hypothetical protein